MVLIPPRFLNLVLLLEATSKTRLQICNLVGRESTVDFVPNLLIVLDSKVMTGKEHISGGGDIGEVAFLLLTGINERTNTLVKDISSDAKWHILEIEMPRHDLRIAQNIHCLVGWVNLDDRADTYMVLCA